MGGVSDKQDTHIDVQRQRLGTDRGGRRRRCFWRQEKVYPLLLATQPSQSGKARRAILSPSSARLT